MTLRTNALRPLSSYGRLGRFYRNSGWVAHLAGLFATYLAFQSLLRLVVLSLLTYVMHTASGRPPRFEEISEIYYANELLIVGYGALAFVFAWKALLPIIRGLFGATRWSVSIPQAHPWREVAPELSQGAIQGGIVAVGIVAALLLSGSFRYLGSFIQLEGAPLALVSLLLRGGAVAALAYSEELLFRGAFLSTSRGRIAPWVAILGTSGAYVIAKWFQFEFGIMQSLSLFLLSYALSVRALRTGSIYPGIAYVSAVWIVLHVGLSLPLFGSEFTGPLLLKPAESGAPLPEVLGRFLTGGSGGPLSSFAFQAILVVDILRHTIQRRPSVSRSST